MLQNLTAAAVKKIALACGFDLAGIAGASPAEDYGRYHAWVQAGAAGEMRYLTDRRGELRQDPANLLPGVKSILCVGKLYNSPYPYSTALSDAERGWISRYAWGEDYHDTLREGLSRVAKELERAAGESFEHRICVDTAPILERSYARLAGLGWIGKNTCLINQQKGSWFFLGELLLNLELQPDSPPPDRCGKCRRCIDACPTTAIVPSSNGDWTIDSRLCISYFTIEKRGAIPAEHHSSMGKNVFGCDICQDVCPWNGRAPRTEAAAFQPREFAPPLDRLAAMTEDEFRSVFRTTPVWRAKYAGFLRNIAIAMGNSREPKFLLALGKLARDSRPEVSEPARLAIRKLQDGAVADAGLPTMRA
ncbi:MAG TPA: tRNA epoxyqueuosine(34) reductase QueG [Bryobacteraceae bacterium]|nr:tRNA epoxyqueuosine(34) reductase QueG [Bryobacteraceae bacterium]